MSKTPLLADSLEAVQKGGIVVCNDVEDIKNATLSKSRAAVSQHAMERHSEGCIIDKETQKFPEEFGSVATNNISVSQGNLFQNEYFKIQRSTIAGLGAIATKNLKEGDVILRERPLFTANANSVFKVYEKLTVHDKDVAMKLYANPLLKPGTPWIQAIWKTNW
ncbi:hypothetical protein E4U53_003845 [Claviceps sorghi]|nr:hypothetical protein E4U53_003845 [Claviceps sorghi]